MNMKKLFQGPRKYFLKRWLILKEGLHKHFHQLDLGLCRTYTSYKNDPKIASCWSHGTLSFQKKVSIALYLDTFWSQAFHKNFFHTHEIDWQHANIMTQIEDQVYSNTRVSTQVNTSPKRVWHGQRESDMSQDKFYTSIHESKTCLDHEKWNEYDQRKSKRNLVVFSENFKKRFKFSI